LLKNGSRAPDVWAQNGAVPWYKPSANPATGLDLLTGLYLANHPIELLELGEHDGCRRFFRAFAFSSLHLEKGPS